MSEVTKDESGPGDNPPKLQAAQASSSIPPDWVARTQYEMTEKIEERVWSWLKTKIAPFGLVIVVLGFLGSPLILDYVTHKIENDMSQNTEILRGRVEQQLADMETKTAELKSQAQTAQDELAELKKLATAVQEVSPQYEALKSQVDEDRTKVSDLEKQVRERLEEANQSSDELKQVNSQIQQMNQRFVDLSTTISGTQQFAIGTQLDVTNLGKALTVTDPNNTFITAGSLVFSRDISLSGQHFGKSRGKIYLQINQGPFLSSPGLIISGATNQPAAPIEIDNESITSWQDGSITLHFSDAMMQQLFPRVDARLPQSPISIPQISLYYDLTIQTATGQTSNPWSIQVAPSQ